MMHTPSAGDASEPEWFKSSYSDSSSGNDCVEVATAVTTVHVRDSKNVPGSRLSFASGSWADFVAYASRN